MVDTPCDKRHPRTIDGILVESGMWLWDRNGDKHLVGHVFLEKPGTKAMWGAYAEKECGVPAEVKGQHNEPLAWWKCYSTKAAMEADINQHEPKGEGE